MRIIEKTLRCDQSLCPGCQRYELAAEVGAGGLWMLSVGEPEPDNEIWDKLDGVLGILTRGPVQRAMDESDDYSFTYPRLYIDQVSEGILEDAKRSGATIESSAGLIVMSWSLPSPCGILPFHRLRYRIAIDDTVTHRQLQKETEDYCTGEGDPKPKGDDLLSRMKKTARHKHTNYDDLRAFLKSRGRLESRGVDAIRLAVNEEIEKVHPPLKGL